VTAAVVAALVTYLGVAVIGTLLLEPTKGHLTLLAVLCPLLAAVVYFQYRAFQFNLPELPLPWHLGFLKPRHPDIHPDGVRFARAAGVAQLLALLWIGLTLYWRLW
jgi:hypothetical protein